MAFAQDDEGRQLFGVNRWDGLTWFNAEAYRLGSTSLASAAVATGRASEGSVIKLVKQLDSAVLAAGWCLERCLEALTSPLPAAAKAGASARKKTGKAKKTEE